MTTMTQLLSPATVAVQRDGTIHVSTDTHTFVVSVESRHGEPMVILRNASGQRVTSVDLELFR